ncbi:MAG: DUF1176 domain-containing protein [Mesorhizobium sp.]
MPPAARIAAFFALAALPAAAQEAAPPPYLDNRSDAAELVRSLYNAVNRREYARAWSYFGETKPASDLARFADGYKDTARVDVETGGIAEEGAAGSVFYSVPVAIRATANDGSAQLFAGCYAARLANPQIQDGDFRPLQLEKGTLKPAEGNLADALPADCGEGRTPPSRDAELDAARKRFAADYSQICDTLQPDADPNAAEPASHVLLFRLKAESESDPERRARLFAFPCTMAAYNTTEVYYLLDSDGRLAQLQFATPELDIHTEKDDPEGRVEAVNIVGYTAADQLVNSAFSEESKSIDSHDKWRGAGDASDSGRWIFREGTFTLVKYDVDASYDGEINPETVLDYDTPP